MNRRTEELREKLEGYLRKGAPWAVAYSGGVDSATLVALMAEILPREQVTAVLVDVPQLKRAEKEEALAFLAERGIPCLKTSFDSFALPSFAENLEDRCYACKRRMMEAVLCASEPLGAIRIADGQNADDEKGYRPGAKAAAELGILSPFKECDFTKADVRALAKDLGLSVADKPADSCLATRFPYGTRLSAEKLRRVEAAEALLKARGIRTARVRVHDDLARIEVSPEDFGILLNSKDVTEAFHRLGFRYVTLDLEGYRRGSFDTEDKKK